MEKKLNRTLYIIPAIYLLLTTFFFYQHYSQKILFSQAIGNIELTGQSTKGTQVKPSEIKKLNIYVNGMSFNFSTGKTLEVKTEDDILHKSRLLDYTSNEDQVSLHFENDINLIFKTDFADNKISISADLPETVPPITELSLPFVEDRGFSLGYTEEDNTPVISNGETNYFIALTNEYKLDNDNKIITIQVSESTPITFMIQETLVGKGRTAEKWYEQNDNEILAEFNDVISNYINSAFFGWNTRFNSKTGMWTNGNGVQEFNENTAISYLSESLVRGSYRTAASLIRTASVNLEDSLTAETAPYLGNIVEKGKEYINTQKIQKREILLLLSNSEIKLLDIDDLIKFMLANGLENEIEDVVKITLDYDDTEELSLTLKRLELLYDAYNYINEEELNAFVSNIIENRILPAVTWLDEGLFLEDKEQINIEESFIAGMLINNLGNTLNNEFYNTVGQKMIISILNRAGESSFLPEKIIPEDNKIYSETGTLLPEQFYFDLTENPYYFKQGELNDTLGSGSWILTSSKSYNVTTNGRETEITMNFPRGSIQHFAIKGIKPFTRVYMHDIKWPSDPNFQRYSDGWYYDKTTETLFVKLKHRVDNEKIRILYYYPETPTPDAPVGISAPETGTTAENS